MAAVNCNNADIYVSRVLLPHMSAAKLKKSYLAEKITAQKKSQLTEAVWMSLKSPLYIMDRFGIKAPNEFLPM